MKLQVGDIVYFGAEPFDENDDSLEELMLMVESTICEGELMTTSLMDWLRGDKEIWSESNAPDEWIPLWEKVGFSNLKVYREVTE